MPYRGAPLTLLRRLLSGAGHDTDPTLCHAAHGPCTRYTAVWDSGANVDYLRADGETRQCVDAVVRQLVVRPEAVWSTWSVARRCWTAPLVTGRGVGQLDFLLDAVADRVVVSRLAL